MTHLFGVVAAFETPEAIQKAAAGLRENGFRAFESYTPFPVEELDRIVQPRQKGVLALLMFGAAVVGASIGFWIQYWQEAINYPINVGGRPYNSWPAFTVSAFEIMLLVTITVGLVSILIASNLPKLYHPIFESKQIERASRDRFVICVEAKDPLFELASVHQMLERLGASEIEEVRT